ARPVEEVILPSPGMSAAKRADVYREQYWWRVTEEMSLYYPAVQRALGKEAFAPLIQAYAVQHPPNHYNIFRLRDSFPEFLRQRQCEEAVVELALLERTVRDVGDQPFAPVPPGHLAPSVRLLALRYPVHLYLKNELEHLGDPSETYLVVFRDR